VVSLFHNLARIAKYANHTRHRVNITFNVLDRKPKNGDRVPFNIFEDTLIRLAPRFYGKLNSTSRRVKNADGLVYDVVEKPVLFEAILHWIDRGEVLEKPYYEPCHRESHYLELYDLAANTYELPDLSNAIIDSLYDMQESRDIQLQMINKAYSITEPGDGLRRLYFDWLLGLSNEEFDATNIEEPAIIDDLREAAKKALMGNGIGPKENYHNAEDDEDEEDEEDGEDVRLEQDES
jgi:hypothetical protein